jgi:hypothetical protein
MALVLVSPICCVTEEITLSWLATFLIVQFSLPSPTNCGPRIATLSLESRQP